MKCPVCSHRETKVIETREVKQGQSTRRRRQCENCSQRFTTYESIQVCTPSIIKRDNRREAFSPQKILNGLKKACEKRPVSINEIDDIINETEKFLMDTNQKEVDSRELGNFIMKKLFEKDSVSFVRFASFYWDFNDISSFINELNKSQNHKQSFIKEERSHVIN